MNYLRNIDSDGDECDPVGTDENEQYTLWFTYDLKVHPPPPQTVVELEANVMDSATLCIPLSNPFPRPIDLIVLKQGPCLGGIDSVLIPPKEKFNYELVFSPKQIGNFRGSLIFVNEEFGEFWYDIKLVAIDALPVQLEPIESELGKYASQVIKVNNPLDEPVKFRTVISNTNYFGLEDKKNEYIHLEPNEAREVVVVFVPGAIGLSDHYSLLTFINEKIGNLTHELKGIGLAPEIQEIVKITAEVGQGHIVNINFRNTTDSSIYCDLCLLDEKDVAVLTEPDSNPIFNILLSNLKNIHMNPKSILDIPIFYNPAEMNQYNLKLVITARREGQTSWIDPVEAK